MDSVSNWMKRAVETGSWRQFDDLHVDDSVSGGLQKDWVNSAVCLFQDAIAHRDSHYPEYAVLLGFSLSLQRPNWNSREELSRTICPYSPPSVYVFGSDSDELLDALSDAFAVALPAFLTMDVLAYHRPKIDADENSAASLLIVSETRNASRLANTKG